MLSCRFVAGSKRIMDISGCRDSETGERTLGQVQGQWDICKDSETGERTLEQEQISAQAGAAITTQGQFCIGRVTPSYGRHTTLHNLVYTVYTVQSTVYSVHRGKQQLVTWLSLCQQQVKDITGGHCPDLFGQVSANHRANHRPTDTAALVLNLPYCSYCHQQKSALWSSRREPTSHKSINYTKVWHWASTLEYTTHLIMRWRIYYT